jgi:hypothetical protein
MLSLSTYRRGFGRTKPHGPFVARAFNPWDSAAPLAGAWLFNNNSLMVPDWSGNGNTAAIKNANGAMFAGGQFKGQALWVRSLIQNVGQVADSASLKPASLTIIAWVYALDYTANNVMLPILYKASASTSGVQLYADTTGMINFFTKGSSSNTLTSAPQPTARWYQVAATINSSTGVKRIFINGTQVASATGLNLNQDAATLFLGANGTNASLSDAWDGYLDHILYFAGELQPGAIWQAYQEPFLFFSPPHLVNLAGSPAAGFPFRQKSRVARKRRLHAGNKRVFLPGFSAGNPLSSFIAPRRRRRPARRTEIRKRIRKVPPNPASCNSLSVQEVFSARLDVQEVFSSAARVVETLSATGLAEEVFSARASVQAALDATLHVISCH